MVKLFWRAAATSSSLSEAGRITLRRLLPKNASSLLTRRVKITLFPGTIGQSEYEHLRHDFIEQDAVSQIKDGVAWRGDSREATKLSSARASSEPGNSTSRCRAYPVHKRRVHECGSISRVAHDRAGVEAGRSACVCARVQAKRLSSALVVPTNGAAPLSSMFIAVCAVLCAHCRAVLAECRRQSSSRRSLSHTRPVRMSM